MTDITKYEQLYYDQGYFVTTLPNHVLALLWNEVHSTEWIDDTAEHIYKKIPKWYQGSTKYQVDSTGSNRSTYEREIGNELLIKTPSSLIEIADLMLNIRELAFFQNYYKQSKLMYLDLWNGSEEIAYHFDTINGADTLLLIYLTEQPLWEEEWGGQISLKKQINDVIITEQVINPLNGTMVVINNANPLVKHRVRALQNTAVNRYTFSFNYKWF
jgi:hypothetical protein